MKVLRTQASTLAARYAENAPAVTACCNTCRTCVTTNVLGLAAAAGVAAIVPIRRLLHR